MLTFADMCDFNINPPINTKMATQLSMTFFASSSLTTLSFWLLIIVAFPAFTINKPP